MKTSHFFLGANSRCGFHSLYGGFCPPDQGFLHIIKGGPGCGKSSFMRRIGAAAEARGLDVDYVLCSGDPDSLDGVYIPALGVGYVDGTAPHSMDVPYPAAAGAYIDLGRFYDSAALKPHAEEIMDLNRRYKGLYAAAYGQIAAGTALMPKYHPGLWGPAEEEKLRKKLRAFAKRELREADAGGKRELFLGAMSCKGRMFLTGELCGLERVYIADNELGLGHFYLSALLALAEERGCGVTVCRDCLDPGLISGLILPGLSLGIFCSDSGIDLDAGLRHLRLDAMADREALAPVKSSLRRSKRLGRDCLTLAADTLAEAKALHDELEKVYNPHVDFGGVYAEAERHIKSLFG